MGLSFRKTIKLGKNTRLNVSKSVGRPLPGTFLIPGRYPVPYPLGVMTLTPKISCVDHVVPFDAGSRCR